MLFTRESDYAMRLLRNLNKKEPTGVGLIVGKENMTASIAYKVARKLEKGGLLHSIRGQGGGYVLCRDLSEITLYDIYKIIDHDAFVSICLKPDHVCPLNSNGKKCGMHKELTRIQNVLDQELRKKSLIEMLDDSKF